MHVYLQLTVLKELSLVKKGKFCGELNFCTNLKKISMWNIFIIFCGTAIKRTYLGNWLKKCSEIQFTPVAISELKLVIMTHPNRVTYRL